MCPLLTQVQHVDVWGGRELYSIRGGPGTGPFLCCSSGGGTFINTEPNTILFTIYHTNSISVIRWVQNNGPGSVQGRKWVISLQSINGFHASMETWTKISNTFTITLVQCGCATRLYQFLSRKFRSSEEKPNKQTNEWKGIIMKGVTRTQGVASASQEFHLTYSWTSGKG